MSIIYSDEWKAYNDINLIDFKHEIVKNRLYFINPATQVHTLNIESYWAKSNYRVKLVKVIFG